MSNPFSIIEEFEQALCEYTGAPYAVTVNSCTNALFLALRYRSSHPFGVPTVTIPKRTYVSVPMQIIHVGGKVEFEDLEWKGCYQLKPYNIWDCARLFTAHMYTFGTVQCVSFHWTKTLGIQHGGAILHDDARADEWYRRARFDGRLPGEPPEAARINGWHCLTTPEVAAAGLVRLASLPRYNEPLPNPDYPDLSEMEIFR